VLCAYAPVVVLRDRHYAGRKSWGLTPIEACTGVLGPTRGRQSWIARTAIRTTPLPRLPCYPAGNGRPVGQIAQNLDARRGHHLGRADQNNAKTLSFNRADPAQNLPRLRGGFYGKERGAGNASAYLCRKTASADWRACWCGQSGPSADLGAIYAAMTESGARVRDGRIRNSKANVDLYYRGVSLCAIDRRALSDALVRRPITDCWFSWRLLCGQLSRDPVPHGEVSDGARASCRGSVASAGSDFPRALVRASRSPTTNPSADHDT